MFESVETLGTQSKLNMGSVSGDVPINHKLPLKKKLKDKSWGIANMEYAVKHSSFNGSFFNRQDITNVNIAKGIMDKTDFEYVTNPWGLKDRSLPAELLEFNIIKGKKKVLTGEERKRPFNFTIIASNEDTVSELTSITKDILMSNVESQIVNQLQRDGVIEQKVDKLTGQPIQLEVKTPEELEEYINLTYKQTEEIIAQRSLNYIIRENKFQDLSNYGFDSFLDTNKEIYYIENIANEPIIRKVNSFYFDVAMNPDSPWVEDAERCIEVQLMRPSDIYDRWYYRFENTEENTDAIERYRMSAINSVGFSTPGNEAGPYIQFVQDYNMQDTLGSAGLIPVITCHWKSLRKIGLLTYIDEYGLKQEDVVDENFKITEKAIKGEDGNLVFGQELEWVWITDLWKGTRIGRDQYVDIGPIKSHYSSIDNLSQCKLPYVGWYSNDPSLVYEMKPYQYFYWVLLYRLQLAFASDKGKILLMDITQIPAEMGWNPDRWMYYLDAMKVAFINPHAEGKVKRGGKASPFNQFKDIDMTLGNQINSYIGALDKLDNMLASMTGITPQRQGNITSSETVGGVERSVAQSSYITEYLFATHAEVKRRVLTAALEISKECWKNGKKIHYFDDTIGRVFYEIDGAKYSYFNYDIFVSDSSADFNTLELLKSQAKEIINSNKGTLSDVINIARAKSITEVDSKIRKSERDADKRASQAEQAKIQQQQQDVMKADQKFQQEIDQRESESVRNDNTARFKIITDNETKLMLAGLQGGDENNNGEPDLIEQEKIRLKIAEMGKKDQQFNKQQDNEMKKHNDNMKMKQKDLLIKEKQIRVSKAKSN